MVRRVNSSTSLVVAGLKISPEFAAEENVLVINLILLAIIVAKLSREVFFVFTLKVVSCEIADIQPSEYPWYI